MRDSHSWGRQTCLPQSRHLDNRPRPRKVNPLIIVWDHSSSTPRPKAGIRKTRRLSSSSSLCRLLIAGVIPVLSLLACSDEKPPKEEDSSAEHIKKMIATEEWVQQLTPKLRASGAAMVKGTFAGLPAAVAEGPSEPPWQDLDPTSPPLLRTGRFTTGIQESLPPPRSTP